MPASDRDEALRELGRIAMERREDVGLSLEDIFERTRVRVEYLRGIEQGLYQGFPDLVYIKGFVRTYLGVIGAEELKDKFMEWLSKDNSFNERRLPPTNVLGNTTYPTKGFKLASHFWLFVVLLLVLVGSGCYVWYSWEHNVIIHRFEPTQQTGAILSNDDSVADTQPSSQDHFLSVLPVSSSVTAVDEPEPESAPYLHIKAAATDVWIRVSMNDKVIYERTLKSGSEVSWDLPATARVAYGRSNAATVILNGKELQNASSRGTYYYEPDGTFRRAQ